jgi:hypothetical protein
MYLISKQSTKFEISRKAGKKSKKKSEIEIGEKSKSATKKDGN